MTMRNWPATALTLIVALNAIPSAIAQERDAALKALHGTWLWVEDRTEGRPLEQRGPPMSTRFSLRVDKDALVHVRPRGNETARFDGSATEVASHGRINRYYGGWKDGMFWYENEVLKAEDRTRVMLLRREFRHTKEGLIVKVSTDRNPKGSISLYRHPEDIPLPTPAKATISDMVWLSGDWTGTRGRSSIEERWGPPKGGALLGVSRTVRAGKMRGFEFLRIMERDGGLVYYAQPGGRKATEFVLTKLEGKRAVFDNPRHDYPQRITYEITDDGLKTWIGFINGGTGRHLQYTREGK